MPRPQKQNKCHNWHGPSHNSKKTMPLLKTPWPQLNHPGLNWHIQVTTQHQHAQATTHSTCPTQQSQVTAKLCFRDFPRMRASDTSSATRRFARSVLPPEPSLSLPPSSCCGLGWSLGHFSYLPLSLSLSSLSRSRSRSRAHTHTLEKGPMLQPRRLTVVWNQCRLRKNQRQARGTRPWTAVCRHETRQLVGQTVLS